MKHLLAKVNWMNVQFLFMLNNEVAYLISFQVALIRHYLDDDGVNTTLQKHFRGENITPKYQKCSVRTDSLYE